jgi:hypothetical protein
MGNQYLAVQYLNEAWRAANHPANSTDIEAYTMAAQGFSWCATTDYALALGELSRHLATLDGRNPGVSVSRLLIRRSLEEHHGVARGSFASL